VGLRVWVSFSLLLAVLLDLLFLGNAKRFALVLHAASPRPLGSSLLDFRNSKFLSVRNSKNRISTFLPDAIFCETSPGLQMVFYFP
jgi:hypothetical protein